MRLLEIGRNVHTADSHKCVLKLQFPVDDYTELRVSTLRIPWRVDFSYFRWPVRAFGSEQD
jgi:hypothetical protein